MEAAPSPMLQCGINFHVK
uniref:Uncharacterized protein n=1 Tax=Arundo donax TaxID=35708 RepID=A0A0A9AVU3_ARUDO